MAAIVNIAVDIVIKEIMWMKLIQNDFYKDITDTDIQNTYEYHDIQMQKDAIIQKLKEEGGRITKQRLILLDIILEEDCSCCKEIYYKAVKRDKSIGVATVYRMVNTLEEIGAISRKNMYKIAF